MLAKRPTIAGLIAAVICLPGSFASAETPTGTTRAIAEETAGLFEAEHAYRQQRAVIRRLRQLALADDARPRLERLDLLEYRVEALHAARLAAARRKLGEDAFLRVLPDLERGRFSSRRVEEALQRQLRSAERSKGSDWFPIYGTIPSPQPTPPDGPVDPLEPGGGKKTQPPAPPGPDGTSPDASPAGPEPGTKQGRRETPPERTKRPAPEDPDLKKKKGRRNP